MDARIPFSGFYESKWSGELDNVEDMECEELASDNDVPKTDVANIVYRASNYRRAYEAVAEEFVDYFESWLNESLGLNIKLTFQRMTSPREYNFETDHIHIHISYRDALILARRVGRNAVRVAAKRLFTSRSGFISFYRNDPAEWGRLRGWDAAQLLTLFEAAVDVIGEEDYEWGLYVTMSENGVFYNALAQAVDYKAVNMEIGKLVGRRELQEELEEDDNDDGRRFPVAFHGTQDYVARYEDMNKHIFNSKLNEGTL